MSTAGRRLEVLRAIVIEYVNTNEPVASKAVATSHVTGVSSATIRNDMGVLEDEGLIRQPHTSAGRIPTEAGYRLFVNALDPRQALGADERRIIQHDLADADNLEDAIFRTVRVLAGVTGQVAVAEYPDFATATVRRVELIDLDAHRLLVIVVTTTGRVYERQVRLSTELASSLTEESRRRVRLALNDALAGVSTVEVAGALHTQGSDSAGEAETAACFTSAAERQLFDIAADRIVECLAPVDTTRIVTAGAANLARAGVEFHDVARVLDLLEDQAAILQILQRVHTAPVQVSIGRENQHEALAGAAFVSATYVTPSATPTHVGVIGPTRMDYARSLAAVEAVSGYLSRLLLRQSGLAPGSPEGYKDTGEEAE